MKSSREIIIENKRFRLVIDENCRAKSLLYNPECKECLYTGVKIPLFTITEKRPFNNEIKLAHPNKRTVFKANSVRKEENRLIVGFERISFEAVVSFCVTDEYISFRLDDFIVDRDKSFFGLSMDVPPVDEFRLLQLPVKTMSFGEWLNVSYHGGTAVNLLACSPCERIDSVCEEEYSIMTADAVSGIKLKGAEAALIVSDENELLNLIETFEKDYSLPEGAKSRRSKDINSSIYWSYSVTPENIDEHLKCIKKCGFDKFLIYYTSIFGDEKTYAGIGKYKINGNFGGKKEKLKKMLEKIKAEGIAPGIHVLHTHIGFNTPFLKAVADHRLNLKKHFTLARQLYVNDDKVYVEESPEGSAMHDGCRILKFGGELIKYEGYTTDRPYFFYGCERGYNETCVKEFEIGTIGGLLDVSEYGASSVYIDQNSSLQDEVAEKIAEVYALGFEFIYFDGSEGTNAPYEFHISNAQYKVYKKLDRAPLFCEGAAKTHFGWHMLSGGNAFDVFPMNVFKEKIAQFPAKEALELSKDLTRVNFGWWDFNLDAQPDIYEYGTSVAAAWNCPVTVKENLWVFENHPRAKDIFEVLSRWEEVRKNCLLTDEQRELLKNTDKEHILLKNEDGEYEIAEYEKISGAACGDLNVAAFVFERKGKTYVVCWHKAGEGKLLMNCFEDFVYEDEIGGERIDVKIEENKIILPLSKRRYYSSALSRSKVVKLFQNAVYTD